MLGISCIVSFVATLVNKDFVIFLVSKLNICYSVIFLNKKALIISNYLVFELIVFCDVISYGFEFLSNYQLLNTLYAILCLYVLSNTMVCKCVFISSNFVRPLLLQNAKSDVG